MQLALEQLGFRDVYHKKTLIMNPRHCALWNQALDAKYENKGTFDKAKWDKLLRTHQVYILYTFLAPLMYVFKNRKVHFSNT